jgi:hypothetical protein
MTPLEMRAAESWQPVPGSPAHEKQSDMIQRHTGMFTPKKRKIDDDYIAVGAYRGAGRWSVYCMFITLITRV